MNGTDKCVLLEQKALSLGDFRGWEEHSSACAYCRERIGILEMLDENSESVDIRLGRRNVAALESALSGRPVFNGFMRFRLAYALPLAALTAAVSIFIATSGKYGEAKTLRPGKEGFIAWEMKIPSRELGRKINDVLKVKRSGDKNGHAVKKARALRMRTLELGESVDRI